MPLDCKDDPLKIVIILAPKCTRFIERESGVKLFHSPTLKHWWNIMVFRQMMNGMYKEIFEVWEAMPCAKPCPLTLCVFART